MMRVPKISLDILESDELLSVIMFFGAGSIIMLDTRIGDNVIIGAGSVVTKDCDTGYVYVGNPARKLCSVDDYVTKEKEKFDMSHVYDES